MRGIDSKSAMHCSCCSAFMAPTVITVRLSAASASKRGAVRSVLKQKRLMLEQRREQQRIEKRLLLEQERLMLKQRREQQRIEKEDAKDRSVRVFKACRAFKKKKVHRASAVHFLTLRDTGGTRPS